jgi:hypothetical protein
MVDGAMRGLPIWRVEVDDTEVVILCLREDGTNGLSCTNIFGKYTHSSKLHHVCRFDRRQSNSRCWYSLKDQFQVTFRFMFVLIAVMT